MFGSVIAGCCSCEPIRARRRRWCSTRMTALSLFKGACGRGIYDNIKTAGETVFAGRDHLYNRRFLQMCSHYLVDPVACTPASDWEKGQVENQVGLVRQRFFTPRLRFKTYEEMNAWLLDKVYRLRQGASPSGADRADRLASVRGERPKLVPYAGRFDGFHAVLASVWKTCLVRFDNNKYSVAASAVGRRSKFMPMRIIRQDGRIVADHRRSFGRGDTVYDPWRYVPALGRKRGACPTGRPSRTGCCRPRWSACGASSPASPTAIGRWSTSSLQCSPMGYRRSKLPALRRSLMASTPRMSSSISSPASAIRTHPPSSSPRPR